MGKKRKKREASWAMFLVVLETINEALDLVAKIVDLINHLVETFF